MSTKTRTDLIYQALANLGRLAAGQTPPPEDFAGIDKYIDPIVAELSARDVVTVDDTEAIPGEWFLPIAILVAAEAALDFGLPGIPTTSANPDPVGSAQRRLVEVQYARPTSEPQRTEYF